MSLPLPIYRLMPVKSFPSPGLLMHPMLPPALHGINPRTIWGRDWWDLVRREAYRKRNYHCWACGSKKRQPLEAHENYHIDYRAGSMEFIGVCALCNWCHSFIHSGRLRILQAEKKISTRKVNQILYHGRTTLEAAGLWPVKLYSGPVAPLRAWKLIVKAKGGTVVVPAILQIPR